MSYLCAKVGLPKKKFFCELNMIVIIDQDILQYGEMYIKNLIDLQENSTKNFLL